MDVSPAAAVDRVLQGRAAGVAQQAGILVLKKAMNLEQAGALALLQSVAPAGALASEGPLGTRIDTYA